MSKQLKHRPGKIALTLFYTLIFSIIFAYSNGFSWVYNSLSDFGLISKFFNFSLIISGIALGLFVLLELDRKCYTSLCRLPLIFSSLCLSFIGIFTKVYLFHFICAVCLFILFPTGLFALGHEMKRKNKIVGKATLIISGILFFIWLSYLITWLLYPIVGLAIPEILSLLLCMFWIFIIILKF